MWRKVARLCLRGVTTLSPVMLAACYGSGSYSPPTRLVRTIDAVSKAPIPGIKVTCTLGGPSEWTDNQGEAFFVGYCGAYRAEDTDGEENGSYQTATADGGSSSSSYRERELDLVIEMERK